MNRCENIVNYQNLAMIEAEIDYAKENKIPLSIVKFKHEVDLDDTFFFKDFFKDFYTMINFAPVLYDNKNNFIIIFKNLKLQQSIVFFKKIQFKLQNDYNIKIDRVGISELDVKDTSEELLHRVSKYLIISKRLAIGKIIYGLRDFDFYNTVKREDTLHTIFSQDPNVKIYNFYNGIPIKADATVVEYRKNSLHLQTTFEELLYLQKNEQFLHVKHKKFPNIIKGQIINYNFKDFIVHINNIEFQDNSVADRENIRIAPEKAIRVMIECQNIMAADGIISSIAIDSIVIKVNKKALEKIKKTKECEFILKFRLFAKNSIAVNHITLRAKIFNFLNEEIVFFIMPSTFIKNKILNYITVCKNEIIKNLKQNIMSK